MNSLVLALLLSPAAAQTTLIGDLWVTGKAGVGTTSPTARLEVQGSSAALSYFQVSGVDETPFLTVAPAGGVGLSTTPAANIDVNGSAAFGDYALQLENGGSLQAAFGYAGSALYRHAIRSRHADSTSGNSLDFLVWTPSVGASEAPSMDALSLVTTSTGASVHVRPAGSPDVELEVSDGASTGGGAVHRALEAAHSSRELKTDIESLAEAQEDRALEEMRLMRPARFRYKSLPGKRGRQPLRRGLIYEEAPESVRGAGGSVILDERVANAELALKALMRRLELAQGEIPEP